jgi:triosephosphate isomerase
VQSVFWKNPTGAFTGEISAEMARSMGVKYAIVGHSERRLNLHETDEMVAKKTAAVIAVGMTAVVCVGEPLSIREEGEKMAEAYVVRQLEVILSEVPNPDCDKLIIAYEPFGAISTARDRRDCTPEIAMNMMNAIRALLQRRTARRGWNVLYGGSVNAANAGAYINLGEGALIGGASLKPQEFAGIVNSAK